MFWLFLVNIFILTNSAGVINDIALGFSGLVAGLKNVFSFKPYMVYQDSLLEKDFAFSNLNVIDEDDYLDSFFKNFNIKDIKGKVDFNISLQFLQHSFLISKFLDFPFERDSVAIRDFIRRIIFGFSGSPELNIIFDIKSWQDLEKLQDPDIRSFFFKSFKILVNTDYFNFLKIFKNNDSLNKPVNQQLESIIADLEFIADGFFSGKVTDDPEKQFLEQIGVFFKNLKENNEDFKFNMQNVSKIFLETTYNKYGSSEILAESFRKFLQKNESNPVIFPTLNYFLKGFCSKMQGKIKSFGPNLHLKSLKDTRFLDYDYFVENFPLKSRFQELSDEDKQYFFNYFLLGNSLCFALNNIFLTLEQKVAINSPADDNTILKQMGLFTSSLADEIFSGSPKNSKSESYDRDKKALLIQIFLSFSSVIDEIFTSKSLVEFNFGKDQSRIKTNQEVISEFLLGMVESEGYYGGNLKFSSGLSYKIGALLRNLHFLYSENVIRKQNLVFLDVFFEFLDRNELLVLHIIDQIIDRSMPENDLQKLVKETLFFTVQNSLKDFRYLKDNGKKPDTFNYFLFGFIIFNITVFSANLLDLGDNFSNGLNKILGLEMVKTSSPDKNAKNSKKVVRKVRKLKK